MLRRIEWVRQLCIVRRAGTTVGALLACCNIASALNPSLDVNQYAHTAWNVRDGTLRSEIMSIAQTPDGYLWLGTQFGLLRFDGVRSVPWQPPKGENLPGSNVTCLLAGRDGTLWIGARDGLARWKDGKLTDFPELAGMNVLTLLEDRSGTVWAGTYAVPSGRLCAIQGASVQCAGEDGSLGTAVQSLFETGGFLWAGAGTGLWRWQPGPPKLFPTPLGSLPALTQSSDGSLLIGVRGGLRQLVDGKIEPYSAAGLESQFTPYRLMTDRDGGLWIGTLDRGLIHVHQGKVDRFVQSDGLSGDHVSALFEDREGDIWIATDDGLDRFRDLAAPMISAKQGLSDSQVTAVLAARDGAIWLGTLDDGLNRWNNGQVTIYGRHNGLHDDSIESLFDDGNGRIWVFTRGGTAAFENGRFASIGNVPSGGTHAVARDNSGDLWMSQTQGLVRLTAGNVVEQIPWSRLGHRQIAWSLLPDPERSGLWIGFRDGLGFFKEGQIRGSYTTADGLGQGTVTGLQLDPDGTLWAGTGVGSAA